MKFTSKQVFIFCCAILFCTNVFYYPKWKKAGTEATISWDASGYYMYLPATFIYKDLKKCAFKDEILNEYGPTPNFQQAFQHQNGNYVMKYPIGQAIQYTPFFMIAHLYAKVSDTHKADGFSRPYQFMIAMGSLFFAFLGLFYARKSLLLFFKDRVVSYTLLSLVLGSNYLNYAGIDGAMTHNNLFTIYAILIYVSILYYKKPKRLPAIMIGLLCGLATITRPTELLSIIIPLGIIISPPFFTGIRDRLMFLWDQRSQILLALLVGTLTAMIQPLYWKYVSGDWIVYSYEDQGFSWLRPHLMDGIFSYKSGWLMYSPLMVFSLIGFYFLYRNFKSIFLAIFIFSALFIYVAFAWDIWWYGGALGQRTMVQAYAVLIFPLAAFFSWLSNRSLLIKNFFGLFILIFIYLNLWFTHQAHRGGILAVGQMTKAYYWKTLGTFKVDKDNLKLLDTDHSFTGVRKNVKEIYRGMTEGEPYALYTDVQYTPTYEFPIEYRPEWIRAKVNARIKNKEWEYWKMTQFIVKFKNKGEEVQSNFIRMQRLIDAHQSKNIHIDVKTPKSSYDSIVILFWNADGPKEIFLHDLIVEGYDEPD
jgi:hypothetical protein